jgi:hypothetical protein
MRASTRIFKSGLAAALSLVFWGCAGSSGGSPQFNPASGGHPANYLATHWSDYAQHPDQCSACHGSIVDPNAAGGIVKVSCFTCHPNGPAHPAGWADLTQHGRGLNGVLGADAAPAEWVGMASCGKCHGDDLKGGLASISCTQCHIKAPHPDAPWRNADPSRPNHHNTDPLNAPECWRCHAGNARLGLPSPPATSSTSPQPNCFNGSMCHAAP